MVPRLWPWIGLMLVLGELSGCRYVQPAYWDCRRQWEAARGAEPNPTDHRLTRRMIEAGEQELREAYLRACMGEVD
jgi:hypothetical protein